MHCMVVVGLCACGCVPPNPCKPQKGTREDLISGDPTTKSEFGGKQSWELRQRSVCVRVCVCVWRRADDQRWCVCVCVCVRVRACWYMGLYSSSKEGGCVQGKRRVQSEQKKEREIQDPKVEMSSSERNQQQQGESSAKDNGCCCLHNTNSKKQQQHAQQQRLRRRKKTGHRLVHGGKTGPSFQHPLTLRTSRNCKSGQ